MRGTEVRIGGSGESDPDLRRTIEQIRREPVPYRLQILAMRLADALDERRRQDDSTQQRPEVSDHGPES